MDLQNQKPTLEDIDGKRSLLRGYREAWLKRLDSHALPNPVRKRLTHDVTLLSMIDEDLIRLARILAERSPIFSRMDNDQLREEIVVAVAAGPLQVTALCERLDLTPNHLRNVCRALLKSGRIVQVGNTYALGRPAMAAQGQRRAVMSS